jgi:hypothetical protein
MQINIPAMFGPICFTGSLEEDWNVYGRTDDKWAKNVYKVALKLQQSNQSS